MQDQSYDRRRVENFGKKISPLIRDYLATEGPGAIIGLPTGGRLYSVELYRRLLAAGSNEPYVDVIYFEADKGEIAQAFKRNSDVIRGRNLIVVDDDIVTKQTFEEVTSELESLQKEYELKSVNWAVEHDGPGIARWACNRVPNGTKANV